ncbi:MAG: hypothetical protein NC489_39325 [Ruminococcus flavefaciens]|nr:hypothetical protein [Ruminococcus flavefaciens]
MVKIRLQGKVTELEWFEKILSKVKGIKLVDFSEPYQNGKSDMYRVYGTIEKVTKSRKGE